MRPRSLRCVVPLWSFVLLILWAGCADPGPVNPRDAATPDRGDIGGTPAFFACTDTAQCVEGTACTNWGSGAAYCRPSCADDASCSGYPYAGLRCQEVTTSEGDATGLRVCNDGPRTVLVGGASDACRTSSSCGACTPRAGCGWCGATRACRAGTRTGPSNGTCDEGWAWTSTDCPEDGAVEPPSDASDASLDASEAALDAPDVTLDGDVTDGVVFDAADARFDADACVPHCGGRSCGDDGCGGSCGPCGFGRACTDAGVCSPCARDCDGRACGPDGCGGTCGHCFSGSCTAEGRCAEGACTSACSGRDCGDGGTVLGVPCLCGTCRGDQTCAAGHCGCGPCPSGTFCYQLSCCRPDCTGRVCGTDGCGGSCGDCRSGLSCNAAGRCVCIPRCAGRECGSDGCLGSCGTCPGGQTCTASGTCCTPNCTGRRCGSNGCGGSCGTCTSGQTCNAAGQCVTSCARTCTGRVCGPDGCDGVCGVCGDGLTCTTAGLCVTGSTCTDNGHCVTTVSARRGASCGDASSLDVTVRNDCTGSIAIQLCLRRIDGTCNCGLNSAVAPGGTVSYFTCASTGVWTYRAGSPSDVARGCFPSGC